MLSQKRQFISSGYPQENQYAEKFHLKTCHLTEDRIDRKPAPYEIMVYRISTGMAGFTAVFLQE